MYHSLHTLIREVAPGVGPGFFSGSCGKAASRAVARAATVATLAPGLMLGKGRAVEMTQKQQNNFKRLLTPAHLRVLGNSLKDTLARD
jgi:hypothetical protein